MKLIKILFLFIVFTMPNSAVAQKLFPIDSESKVNFTIKNFGLNVDGNFSGLKGTIVFDQNSIDKTQINLSVNTNSVNTNNKDRDKHLKKVNYFDAEKFPQISFTSTSIKKKIGINKFSIKGNLTIKGITKAVEFDAIISLKESTLTIKGSLQLNRRTFNVGERSMILSDNVKLDFLIVCKQQ